LLHGEIQRAEYAVVIAIGNRRDLEIKGRDKKAFSPLRETVQMPEHFMSIHLETIHKNPFAPLIESGLFCRMAGSLVFPE
jgi:hypothetical protein